jgi:hypothetical protein
VTVTVAAEEKSEQSAPSDNNKDEEDFYVAKMQINKRQNTSWLIIPHKLATRYKLDKRTNVLMLPCKDGIMLKRLNASDIL